MLRMADFRARRGLFAAGQRRFFAVIGPCLIAAITCLALSVGGQGRDEPYPLGVALMLTAIAAALMPIDRDRPGPKLALYAALCVCVFAVFVVL